MATADQIRSEIEQAERDLEVAQNNITKWKQRAERDPAVAEVAQSRIDENAARAERLINRIAELRSDLIEAGQTDQAIENEVARQQPAESAAEAAEAAAPAGPTAVPPQRVENQDVVPAATPQPSTAEPTPTLATGDADTNTDPPVVPLEQTQAPINQPLGQGVPREADGSLRIDIAGVGDFNRDDQLNQSDAETQRLIRQNAAAGSVGTGPSTVAITPGTADQDDQGTVTELEPVTVSASRDAGPVIEPQPNVLDRFSSYTYQASVYMLTPDQLTNYARTKRRDVSGYNLLFQSGGAPVNQQGPLGAAAGVARPDAAEGTPTIGAGVTEGRNPFFTEDFYIDSITLENLMFGKSTQAAHSAATLKFTVIEPNNITLLDRLYQAAQDLRPTSATGAINYAAICYLMVIRFYGYDENGRVVAVGPADETTGLTDPNAVIEKFIPFRVGFINWRVSNELVKYEFDCIPIGQSIGNTTRRATIPADIELSGGTVGSVLTGEIEYSTQQASAANPGASTTATSASDTAEVPGVTTNSTPAPPKANAARAKNVLRQGLIKAMNNDQQSKLDRKEIQARDFYELRFAPGAEAIRDAVITVPAKNIRKDFTGSGPAPSKGNTQALSPDKQATNTGSRNFAITAGQQLVQVIEMIIRNSSYIRDQAIVTRNEDTGRNENNPKANTRGMKWFNIVITAEQLPQYDVERKDFAYRIIYTIVPYELQEFNSLYFPVPRFLGLHKSYPWWFTGQNTAVLNYEAYFNSLYNITMTGSVPGDNQVAKLRRELTTSMREQAFIQKQARSTESDAGAGGGANEIPANAAEYLYTPSDNQEAVVEIIGDPAWIQQGSLTNSFPKDTLDTVGFAADGTINFDVNDVMFEIVWQKPEDYDLMNGLADPYARTERLTGDRQPIQSVIYRAKSVISEFREGKFTQKLHGTLYPFAIPKGTNKAVSATVPTQDPDSQREQAVINGGVRPSTAGQQQAVEVGALGSGLKSVAPVLGIDAGRVTSGLTGLVPGSGTGLLPSLPSLPATSNGLAVGDLGIDNVLGVSAPTATGSSTADLVRQANERNRLNDAATAARQNYERVLAENNNDRLNPAVEAAFAEFQAANQAALAAFDDPSPAAPVVSAPQRIARET